MKRVQRKGSLVAMGLLLACGGVGVGVLASSLTNSSIVWRAPPRIPTTDDPVQVDVDQASAAQAWARSAFDGGLRRCPQINPEFLAACQAEMKALTDRPAPTYVANDRELLITQVEPVDSVPDMAPYIPDAPLDLDRQDAEHEPEPSQPLAEQFADRTPDNYPAEPFPR